MAHFALVFARALRRHRPGFGLTREVLERASLHPTYVSMIETAKKVPTLDAAQRLAKGLGVRLSKLIVEAETTP